MNIIEKIQTGTKLVVGVGSALVDILAHEENKFLEQVGARKGGMTLVDKKFIEETLTRTASEPVIVPGGSACNTVVGVGRLGGRARFVGKSGQGGWGRLFQQDLLKQNVEPALFKSATPTGRVLSIITPDAQRSMFTYLGASSELAAHELEDECFKSAAVVHIEGYLLFNPELILGAVKTARAAGAVISLDLASFTVVEDAGKLLDDIITGFVDIVIANEDEARAFTGFSDENLALRALAEKADIAIVKIGHRGSLIAHDGRVVKIGALGDGSALDTTGAGDLWAAGFLYGLVNGYSIEKCGQIGSACGYEVCQTVGATIPDQGWDRIKKLIG
jgi:sugar/nucleoside kinase (ribokinase family)